MNDNSIRNAVEGTYSLMVVKSKRLVKKRQYFPGTTIIPKIELVFTFRYDICG